MSPVKFAGASLKPYEAPDKEERGAYFNDTNVCREEKIPLHLTG
jgi:hypothetical protein